MQPGAEPNAPANITIALTCAAYERARTLMCGVKQAMQP